MADREPSQGLFPGVCGLGNGHVSGFRGKSGPDLEFLVHLDLKEPQVFGANESAISDSLPPAPPQIVRLLKNAGIWLHFRCFSWEYSYNLGLSKEMSPFLFIQGLKGHSMKSV